MVSKDKIVDGQNILYHYIQKNLILEENEFSKELIRHLIMDLSIWIPANFYRNLPIILPYAVRDRSCRKKQANGKDEWGSANSRGFLRDDNTLLKSVVRSFPIRSSKISEYDGKKLGTGFVASHIWGKVTVGGQIANSSRHYMFNSFVPNIVWLPAQISKLTDREGSFAQRLLQAISHKLYRETTIPLELANIWNTLTYPLDLPEFNFNLREINYFETSEKWLNKRIQGLISEIDTILTVDKNSAGEVKCSRYLPTLKQIPLEQRKDLNEWLQKYQNWLFERTGA